MQLLRPRLTGLLPDEVREGDAERVGDEDQGVEERGGLSALNPHVRGSVHPDDVRDLLLGEVAVQSCGSDLIADAAASLDDVSWDRGGARHPSTLS